MWPGQRLVFNELATLGEINQMSLDEVEVHNRYLDAWLEAQYDRQKDK